MKLPQFLEHHGIARNPFAEEDAQTDPVFKEHCIESTYHPTWDKIYGDPQEPSTSIVFGEKGAGKTAMRLQIARHLAQFNRQHDRDRIFVVHYDDFNPFLDRFRDRLGSHRKKRADRVLKEWKLWDHMDGILSLSVTELVDRVLGVRQSSPSVDGDLPADVTQRLDRYQARDLLLLAACYDQSIASSFKERWHSLRRHLHFPIVRSYGDLALGGAWTVGFVTLLITIAVNGLGEWIFRLWWLFAILLVAGWAPWLWRFWKCWQKARGVRRQMRVGNRDTRSLRQVFMRFAWADLVSQPLPDKDRSEDRYELLMKLQGILKTLDFRGMIVLVDRLDEPHLINGSAELIKALLWPMLDNKFLKHPGLGLKIMAPVELTRFIDREEHDFYQRARLDKQNMIAAFKWSGESLYDVANARLTACAIDGAHPRLRTMLDPAISDQRILQALRSLRTPRHLFKFLYRLFVTHCNSYIDVQPVWTISAETFEATLALYQRDQDACDRGMGAG